MNQVSCMTGRVPTGIDSREATVPMAIVDRMANISPTYLFAIAHVRTSGHLVHRASALSCAEDPGSPRRTYLEAS